jgi:AcrR family transcriptional regulator
VSDRRPAPRRRLSAAERRERILRAAQEVFAQKGYHGAALEEIAQASGTSKALIYEHFDSKRELYDQLLAKHVDELWRRFRANAAAGASGEERLRTGVDTFFAWVEERREAWRALFRDAADPELTPMIERLQAQATGAIVALVSDEDSPPPPQVEMYAALLSGACQALANWWNDHPDVPRSELVDRVVEFSWIGLERVQAGR